MLTRIGDSSTASPRPSPSIAALAATYAAAAAGGRTLAAPDMRTTDAVGVSLSSAACTTRVLPPELGGERRRRFLDALFTERADLVIGSRGEESIDAGDVGEELFHRVVVGGVDGEPVRSLTQLRGRCFELGCGSATENYLRAGVDGKLRHSQPDACSAADQYDGLA